MKYYLMSICLLCIVACGENNTETKEAPGAIESSTQHPNGITGGSVISTDTGAILADSVRLKQDSMRNEK